MTFVESELALLRDPRLAASATSPWPAWLWSADASRMLWANAAGAALFGAADTRDCVQRRFDVNNPAAAQIVRLAATLPSAGPPRLERLRGFGLGFGRALTCACSRLVVTDGKAAVLIAATEPAGPALSLAERVRRLFGDDEPLAVFAADGALVHVTKQRASSLAEQIPCRRSASRPPPPRRSMSAARRRPCSWDKKPRSQSATSRRWTDARAGAQLAAAASWRLSKRRM